MELFLALQNTYDVIEIGLFNQENLIAARLIDKHQGVKNCLPALDQLLASNNISFKDIHFIAANEGPTPFTTLRIILSTVNALSFATGIPLIGINGLESFIAEYAAVSGTNKVALLNAFGSDVYFGSQIGTQISFGCAPISSVLLDIKQKMPEQSILFFGNGVDKYQADIKAAFGTRAHFLDPNPQTVSLKQIGIRGLIHWQHQQKISQQLQPVYLKQAF